MNEKKFTNLTNDSKIANFLLDYLERADGDLKKAFGCLQCRFCPLAKECAKDESTEECVEFLFKTLQEG